ncbi:hypothetical protein ACFPIJ_53460 [Dactylosporangium cerinum]|uniref:Clp R domain-containing protein n=1 Tax=Dactylosporangium cerinum TaxID=1434730 RepID=A0ABV9WE51_9ACTN
MFERFTTDLRSVIVGAKQHAAAAAHGQVTLSDLAAALAVPRGNTADLWTVTSFPVSDAPDPASGPSSEPSSESDFDAGVREVLEESLRVALRQRAPHVGTEHLLAALVSSGAPDVAAWLDERGATASAADDLLARLAGGPGVEVLTAKPTPAEERRWQRATGARRSTSPFLTAIIVVVVIAVLFVLCVWGP